MIFINHESYMIYNAWGVLLASGKAEQLPTAPVDVAFLSLGDKPAIGYSMLAFEKCPEIEGVVIVAPKDKIDNLKGLVHLFGCAKVKKIVPGTTQRLGSVLAGIRAIADEADIIVVHEASRPCVKADLISETIKTARKHGSGVAAAKVTGPVHHMEKGHTSQKILDSNTLWSAQTPQAFKTDILVKALESANKKKIALLDEASAFDPGKKQIRLVPSRKNNIKITGPEELELATALIRL